VCCLIGNTLARNTLGRQLPTEVLTKVCDVKFESYGSGYIMMFEYNGTYISGLNMPHLYWDFVLLGGTVVIKNLQSKACKIGCSCAEAACGCKLCTQIDVSYPIITASPHGLRSVLTAKIEKGSKGVLCRMK
jgi:hypothetical protein